MKLHKLFNLLSDNVKEGVLSYLEGKAGKYPCCCVNSGLESKRDNYVVVWAYASLTA